MSKNREYLRRKYRKRYLRNRERIVERNRKRRNRQQAENREKIWGDKPTLVYVISCGQFCKIGIARNIVNRFQSMQSACPIELKLEFASLLVPRHMASQVEIDVFSRFSVFHIHGEWFKVNSQVLTDFVLSRFSRSETKVMSVGSTQLRLIS